MRGRSQHFEAYFIETHITLIYAQQQYLDRTNTQATRGISAVFLPSRSRFAMVTLVVKLYGSPDPGLSEQACAGLKPTHHNPKEVTEHIKNRPL